MIINIGLSIALFFSISSGLKKDKLIKSQKKEIVSYKKDTEYLRKRLIQTERKITFLQCNK